MFREKKGRLKLNFLQEGAKMKELKNNKQNKLLQAKKADISVTLLVFMTLALVGASLFVFITSGKIDKRISDAKFLESTYAIEDKADFYLADAFESAIVEAYKNIVEEQAFVGSGCSALPEKTEGIEKEFCRVDSNTNAIFKEKITGYFKENIKSLEFPESEDVLNGLKNNIEQNKFSVEFDGKNAALDVKEISINFTFIKKRTKKILWIIPAGKEITILIGVNYEPNIMIETELIDLGLADFEAIYQKSAECRDASSLNSCDDAGKEKVVDAFKTCIGEKLADFAVGAEARCNVLGNDAYYLTTLASKKEFLIGKNFETISIKFLAKAAAKTE